MRSHKPIWGERLKNQVINIICKPYNMIVFSALGSLICLILVPLLLMVKNTFILSATELRRVQGGQIGDVTLYYWKYLLLSKLSGANFFTPLKNSLFIAFFVTIAAVLLGFFLAWLMVRSDIPGKKWLTLGIIIPYMIPSWCKSMAWLAIFRNGRGGSPGFLAGLGFNIPDWLAYGPIAIILCMVLHYYAFTYIMVSSSLRTVNSELEEMGEIQGADKLYVLRKITMPLVMPAVLSSAIMTFSKAIGTYGVAANLGLRISYYTLATKMHDFIGSGSVTVGYCMSILLIFMASGTIFANQIFIGSRKSYETIGGKGNQYSVISLGKVKYPIMLLMGGFLIVAMLIPLFILVMETFQIHTGGGYGLHNLTLYNWIGKLENAKDTVNYPGIFNNNAFIKAVWNTVKLTVIGSTITALCGQLLGYICSRGRGTWYGSLVEQLIFIPYLMPAVAFAAIYLSMFSKSYGPIPSLYGTFTIILLATVVKHFPFASRSGTANMLQIGRSLEEAATIAGASFWKQITRIVIPLAKNGFVSGFLLVFISIAKELDLIILFMTPQNNTLSYLAFQYSKEVMPQMSDAISVVVLFFVMLIYFVTNKLTGADIGKSWG
ncbi:iron(III) transport system permease protein [Lachnotalea glycerini]|uniref:Iron(III) transport system permease protein n=1 Tax=Lachnotalea glycerini TaxID=1763509 RepID=A0A318EU55_9FIRM|nr:iron ABC transporter permease [Lachnotalea glycerini]PXV93459.1 iron(III) transport system permease protein [Lachnotalea glycerini]